MQQNPKKKDTQEDFSVNEIIEKAADLCKDHNGSGLIQKKYEDFPPDIRIKIFKNLKPQIFTLSKDIFGNYAIQKILGGIQQVVEDRRILIAIV